MTELDRLLDAAKPAKVGSTPTLRHELNRLVLETERHSRARRRRRLRVVAAAGAFTFVAGGGTLAAASGLIPTPISGSWDDEPSSVHVTMAMPSGQKCTAVYTVVPVEVQEESADKSRWREAYRVASKEMKGVDPERIPIADAVQLYEDRDEQARAELARTLPKDEIPPRGTPDEIQIRAVGAYLFERVDQELRQAKMPSGLLTMSSGDNCAPPGASR